MSQQSIINTRLWKWLQACSVWEFEIEPPFKEETLAGLPAGEVRFRARRTAVVDGQTKTIIVDVSETWVEGSDPNGDWRLDAEGCHLGALEWHAQVGAHSGDQGAERLEVVPDEDEEHPRIHQHPYREANDVRLAANLSEPIGWLSALNVLLRGALDDGLEDWDRLAGEED